MKLRKGRARYKIPAFSKILHVIIDGNQRHNQMFAYRLIQVPMSEIADRVDTPAMPLRFAANEEGALLFWPPPDKPYVVKVRYFPPLEEF